MGRPRIVHCKGCGRHIDECGPLSARKLCEDCGLSRIRANAEAMMITGGYGDPRWAAGMSAYGERLLRTLDGDS